MINWTDIPGETGPTLTKVVEPGDTGQYRRLDTNIAGSTPSNAADIVVHAWHPDTVNYLTRVEAEDGQSLEPAIAEAWDAFFRAMDDPDHPTPTAATHKIALAEGTLIPMFGARTLASSLLPLYPDMPSPTNVGIVTGDYDRVLGIQFDGSTKYIDLGVKSGDLPQDDVSQGVHITAEASSGIRAMIGYGGDGITGSTRIARHSSVSTTAATRSRSATTNNATGRMSVGVVATSRVQDDEYDIFGDGGISVLSSTSQSSASGIPVLVGASGTDSGAIDHSDHRSTVAWHCLSIDLAYMDSCLTTLQSAIAGELPPVVTGEPYQGQTLTSTATGQWYINDVAVSGETGDTFVVPETVLLGDKIRCGDSIALEVIRIPGSWGVRIDTTRTTEKTTDSDQFHMMGRSGVNETITIYWGDGTKSVCDTWNHADRIHTYADEGEYDMQVVGVTTADFRYTASLSDLPKIVSIDQWGNPWGSIQHSAFRGTESPNKLNSLPDDTGHGLASLTTGDDMFRDDILATLPDGMALASLSTGTNMFYNNNLTTLPAGMTLASLTNGTSMFRENSLTALPEGMTLDSLTIGHNMFYGNNLTALPDSMTLDSLPNGIDMFRDNNLTTLPAGMMLASLTAGSNMFRGNNLTTLPDGMTLDSLPDGTNMFLGNSLTTLPDGMTLASVTGGSSMFQNNSLTTLPDSVTLASLTNGPGMFSGNTINTEDYSGLLIRMEAANPNSNVVFHGGNSKYNSAAAAARAELVNRGWTITDGGPE